MSCNTIRHYMCLIIPSLPAPHQLCFFRSLSCPQFISIFKMRKPNLFDFFYSTDESEIGNNLTPLIYILSSCKISFLQWPEPLRRLGTPQPDGVPKDSLYSLPGLFTAQGIESFILQTLSVNA